MTQRKIGRNPIKFFVYMAILTTSFDIFLVVNIGGFNFRFTQLMIIPVFVSWTLHSIHDRKVKSPYGMIILLIWVILQTLFSFRSPDMKNALGYDAWLIFNVIGIYSISYFIDKKYDCRWLLKTYINSYCIVSMIGLVQFILYPLGINFYVAQKWNAYLARINGFSYEPSYYATYLIMGFIAVSYLIFKQDKSCFTIKQLRIRQYIIGLALILSSSRMGWLMVVLWLLFKLYLTIKEVVISGANLKRIMLLLRLLIGIGALAIGFLTLTQSESNLTFLLSGLGLGGTSAHSVNGRTNGLLTCIEIFKKQPFMGYGLGGVDPLLAQYLGYSFSTTYNGHAMSIIGELLVGTGLIGVTILLLYLIKMFKYRGQRNRSMINAIKLSLFFELIILCFNQNILRSYLWMHIAIMSALYKNSEKIPKT